MAKGFEVERVERRQHQRCAETETEPGCAGTATIEPYDEERAHRKLCRYLGYDKAGWPSRFSAPATSSSALVRLAPAWISARDLSYQWPET